MGEVEKPKSRRAASVLTAAKVKTAVPGNTMTGRLGVDPRVDPNEARFWIRGLTIHGKRRELGCGSPPIVSLAKARDQAADNKRLARAGGDPLAEKRKARDNLTFVQAVERYLATKLDEFRNEKHRKQWRATLDTYAKPKLGHLNVRAIGMNDVLRVLEPIWKTKNETASRLRGRIEAVLLGLQSRVIGKATTRQGGKAIWPRCWPNRPRWPRVKISPPLR